jgi:hypothetical protein
MIPMGEMRPAGWYPDPSGQMRYFDGLHWTQHTVGSRPPAIPPPPPPVEPSDPVEFPPPAGVVVTGPNHVLHAVLTLLTFWACGGWAWRLIVALHNKKRVRTVDAYGNVIDVGDPSWTPQELAAAQTRAWRAVAVYGTIVAVLVVIAIIGAVVF